jgi:translation initiation factor 3 subunit H
MSEFSVVLDGTVVLQVIQHFEDSTDNSYGKLVGYESDNSLIVVNSFALPADLSESDAYTAQRLKYFQDLKFESFVLGWYQKASEGAFLDIKSIEFQYNLQLDFPKSFMLVYNPIKSQIGEFPLSAYILSEEFMSFFADEEFTTKKAKDLNLKARNVFINIPVKVENHQLTEGFLAQFGYGTEEKDNSENLRMFLERHLEGINKGLEDFIDKEQKLYSYIKSIQRQKQQQRAFEIKRYEENRIRSERGEPLLDETEGSGSLYRPIPQPSSLEPLLIAQLLNNFSVEIDSFCSSAQTKINLLSS